MATYSAEEFQKKMQTFVKRNPKVVVKAIDIEAMEVRNHAVKNHLSGPKMPKGVGSESKGTLQPRSGNLRNRMSHRVKLAGNKITGQIFNMMVYAAVHEYGYPKRKIPERSYARASLKARQKEIPENILKRIKQNWRTAR
jgi:phage gpG-like protein